MSIFHDEARGKKLLQKNRGETKYHVHVKQEDQNEFNILSCLEKSNYVIMKMTFESQRAMFSNHAVFT
ncbi:hypothetical protein M493_12040 [Geobacillus genomosp. 3]|uniref:Uncharacterized protein n=1 Tax=Geobacillus genomosp. 3 TaxID=1921421 RepID=S5ZEE5_GEOG3|nr:hypothetical protein M493_12040 [Geobacillus genomosp. 3]